MAFALSKSSDSKSASLKVKPIFDTFGKYFVILLIYLNFFDIMYI